MLGQIESDVKEVSVRVIPVLENMEVITSKLRSITANVDDQMSIVRSSVQSLKEIADNVLDFERQVQDRIEAPVLEVAGILGLGRSRHRRIHQSPARIVYHSSHCERCYSHCLLVFSSAEKFFRSLQCFAG